MADFLNEPNAEKLLRTVMQDGESKDDDVSLELVGSKKIGGAQYGVVSITKSDRETMERLESLRAKLNYLCSEHMVHRDVIGAMQELVNFLVAVGMQHKEAHMRTMEMAAALPQVIISSEASRKAVARHSNTPQQESMAAIREEFMRWQDGVAQYANDAAFALAMHARYAGSIRNEGSIKNACSRWRKERK